MLRYLFRHFLGLFCCCITYYNATAIPDIRTTAERVPNYNNEVYAIVKDAKGLLWLATKSGLSIYDGFETTEIPALKNIPIRQLSYNKKTDELWAAAKDRLYLIPCKTQNLKLIKQFPKDKSIVSISQDQTGNSICVATSDSVISIINESGTSSKSKVVADAMYVAAISNENIFFTDRKNIFRYSANTNTCIFIKTERQNLAATGLWHIQDTLLLGTWYHGLQLFDATNLKDITPDCLKAVNKLNNRLSVATLQHDILFAAYANYNFFLIDIHSGWQQNLSLEFGKVFYGKKYNCILADENVVWLGTDNGLIKINLHRNLFQQLLSGNVPTTSTRSILHTRQGMYISSYDGLYHFDSLKKSWQNINDSFIGNKKFLMPYALLDCGRYLYLVLESKFLYRYDKLTKTVSDSFYPSSVDKPLGLGGAYTITHDANGIIWIGTKNGIVSYDTGKQLLSYHDDDRFMVQGSMVKNLFYDRKHKQLFAATNNGLYILNIDNDSSYHISSSVYQNIHSSDFNFSCSDSSGNIWIATNGDGIYVIDKNRSQVWHFTKDNGLADNIVYNVVFENKTTAWMGTYNGLSRFDVTRNSFSNYYEEDGLSNNQFNQNSFLGDGGKMYFGGINGVNVFQPEMLQAEQHPFHVYVSGVKKWILKGDEIVQPAATMTDFKKMPSDFAMGIMLGTSDFEHPEKAIFLYRINGINEDWKLVKTPHTLRLDGLPYGNYDVSIKALNFRGQASENVLKISVKLVAPFYYHWWFFVLIVLFLAIITYAIVRYKVKELKKYQELRVQIASDLHDEVGSILTSIGMYSDNLKHSGETAVKSQQKIDKIAALSRTAILSMRDILWAIDARNDMSVNLAEHIRNHAEEMLSPKNINIHFKFQGDASQRQLNVSTRQHLYFITKEAINNIVKHSNANNVYINFINRSEHFDIEIANDGITDNAVQEKGQGLKNMQSRAEKMKAEFTWKIKNELFTVNIKR